MRAFAIASQNKIMDLLERLPLTVQNPIKKSHIDAALEDLANGDDEQLCERSQLLMERWGELREVYEIPRRASSLGNMGAGRCKACAAQRAQPIR